MLSPGEAVIPAEKAEKYKGLITAIIAGKVPGFKKGVILPKGPDQAANAFVKQGGSAIAGADLVRDFIYKQLTLAVTKGSDKGQAAFVAALEKILTEAPKKISVESLKKDPRIYSARSLYDKNIQAKMPDAPVFAHSGAQGHWQLFQQSKRCFVVFQQLGAIETRKGC